MEKTIQEYNNVQTETDKAICNKLFEEINKTFLKQKAKYGMPILYGLLMATPLQGTVS